MSEAEVPVVVPIDLEVPKTHSRFRDVPWQPHHVAIGIAGFSPWLVVVHLPERWLTPLQGWTGFIVYVVFGLGWLLAYPLWVASRNAVSPIRPFPSLRKLIIEALVSLLCSLALLLVVGLVVTVWRLLFEESTLPETAFDSVSRLSGLYARLTYLALACTLGPLAEEVFFRGFLYNAARRLYPPVLAAIPQAILFAAFHQKSLSFSAMAFCTGLLMAALYEWRKTLLAPFFVHATYNGIAVGLALLALLASLDPPRLGVYGDEHEYGVLITKIEPGSTAEEIDLRPGDVITTFDGQPVTDNRGLAALVQSREVGQRVRIEVIRKGRHLSKEAMLRRVAD